MSEEFPHGVRLIVSYDGDKFCGYQWQDDQRTVQGVLEESISGMAGHPVRVRGAGRTDSGVHALHQVVAFDAKRNIDPRGWMLGLNGALPADVSIVSAATVPPKYDPRYDALDKTYRYLVLFNEPRQPIFRNISWHMPHARLTEPDHPESQPRFDVEAVRVAAQRFVGKQDFKAFRASDDDRKTTIREILEMRVTEGALGHEELLSIEVKGRAFLKNMVRIIVGTLVNVGRGRTTLSEVDAMFGPNADRQISGQTAPAHGLTLMHITLGRLEASR